MSFYGTRSDADTYHSARGNTVWDAASVADRDAALLRASDYIDGRYQRRLSTGAYTSMFPGTPVAANTDGRQWPRVGASDGYGRAIADDEIPDAVKRATYEAALRELATPGSLSPDYVPADKVTQEKVGPLSVTYATEGQSHKLDTPNRPVIPAVDEILAPLLQGGSASLGVAMTFV